MKAILVSVEGTICDERPRHSHEGTPAFYQREQIQKDLPVPGSVHGLQELFQNYTLVYLGRRPASTRLYTEEWLKKMGFPEGGLYMAESHEERLQLVRELKKKVDFAAGIGSRWEDNVYHGEIGCFSIILNDYEGDWLSVPTRIAQYEVGEKVKENKIFLKGKIEGLSRVLPLLHAKYGDEMWDIYYEGLFEMLDKSREERKDEDLESLTEKGFDPKDMRDIAQWYILLNEDWKTNPNFGLQQWEIVKSLESRCVVKVSQCLYAEYWKECGHPDIGYQIHCRPDILWMDRPAWNQKVRFEHPKTLMQGDDCCLFIQYLPEKE